MESPPASEPYRPQEYPKDRPTARKSPPIGPGPKQIQQTSTRPVLDAPLSTEPPNKAPRVDTPPAVHLLTPHDVYPDAPHKATLAEGKETPAESLVVFKFHVKAPPVEAPPPSPNTQATENIPHSRMEKTPKQSQITYRLMLC